MNKEISRLPIKLQEEIIGKYYGNVKLADIISDYNLSFAPKSLIWKLPPEVLDENCRNCNGKLQRERASRSPHAQRTIYKYCSRCRHTDEVFCDCRRCRDQRWDEKKNGEQSEKELINNLLNYNEDNKIDIEDLSLTDKIILGALLREGISEDYNYIKPINKFNNPLAPTDVLTLKIIDRLIEINAVVIHPSTSHKYIEITDYNNGNYDCYPLKVKWALNVKNEELDKFKLIESIINPGDLDNSQFEEAVQLWKIIAIYESKEIFKFYIKKFLGIDYEIGIKTENVLIDLTNYFSVAQISGIMHKAVMNAVILQAGHGISKKGAAKTITGYVESYGERAKMKKRKLKKLKRVKACPESALSKFFFERIIKIGYKGFSEVPNISKIQNKPSESDR